MSEINEDASGRIYRTRGGSSLPTRPNPGAKSWFYSSPSHVPTDGGPVHENRSTPAGHQVGANANSRTLRSSFARLLLVFLGMSTRGASLSQAARVWHEYGGTKHMPLLPRQSRHFTAADVILQHCRRINSRALDPSTPQPPYYCSKNTVLVGTISPVSAQYVLLDRFKASA